MSRIQANRAGRPRDFGEVLRDEAIVQRVTSSGSVVRALPGPEFAGFIQSEITKWSGAARFEHAAG